jgi:co-chaperonin GroES (HSP10)
MTTCLVGIVPARGLAFVRHPATEETYCGGTIIIPETARDKVARQQMIVVSVGDYEFCEDVEECNRLHWKGFMHKHGLQIGDWVLCRNRSWSLTPDPDVYVIRVVDILGIFTET